MKSKLNQSRRKFITTTAKGVAVISAAGLVNSCSFFSSNEAGKIPRRKLGKTGLEVSILSFGGGSQFLRNENGEWEKSMELALENGVNLFDTAPSYKIVGKAAGQKLMSSEERFGEILPAYRDKVIITTKVDKIDGAWKPEDTRKSVEDGLKRMKTDYLDILFLHSIDNQDNIAEMESGVYKEAMKLKEEGIIKHIGFSSMDSAQRSKELLEALDFDAAILAINPTRWGNYAGIAVPAAQKRDVGVIAMKVFRGVISKEVTANELLEYAWTENHVASAVIGHYELKTLKENIKLAIEYGKNLQVSVNREELESRLAKYGGPHVLPWARPGYVDGGIVV